MNKNLKLEARNNRKSIIIAILIFLGFKANNIKKVKDHVFYNEHDLDRYGPDELVYQMQDEVLKFFTDPAWFFRKI